MPAATFTVVSEDEVLVGSVVAERYHVSEVLGQGSTGTVFGAEHVHFGRGAAMKVLRPRYTSPEAVLRVFHGEARAAWSVSHPSLCEVFDIGTLPDGAPFFVMERLHGEPLATRLGRDRLSMASGVDLLMQLLSVIDAIHGRDLLLRDLRPQNLFLVHRRGCRALLKILDFGLARLIPIDKISEQWDALRAVTTADGAGAQSVPYYLSPERALDGENAVQPASDLFVAAVIFYEAMTAHRPFEGATFDAVIDQITRGQPQALSSLRPDVSPELDDIIARALSKDPRSRPQSAREMQDELRAVFESAKRGSASVRAAAASARPPVELPPPAQDSTLFTPVLSRERDRAETDRLIASQAAPEPLARAPGSDAPEGLYTYEDQTRTDQQHQQLLASSREARREPVDEAAAESPNRTVRPPSAVDIEVDVDFEAPRSATGDPHEEQTTARGLDVAAALALGLRSRAFGETGEGEGGEEEETETMQLTPEIRERIERMTKAAGTMPVALPPSGPRSRHEDPTGEQPAPQTRRLGKPDR